MMLFVIYNNLCTNNYPKLAQNTISNELKFKAFLREHASRLPAFGNYCISKLYDFTRDLFSHPVLTTFWHPCTLYLPANSP